MRGTDSDVGAIAPVVEACVSLFHPYLEAVLHDVRKDRIVRIWNPVSGRRVGGPSYLERDLLRDLEAGKIIGPFPKVESDGRQFSSVSVPLAGGDLLLCLNFDRSVTEEAASLLSRFAAPTAPRSRALFERDWREAINEMIDDWCRDRGRRRESLGRSERLEIVATLDDKGLFATRYAAAHVAKALLVSRSTVYGLLAHSRQSPRA